MDDPVIKIETPFVYVEMKVSELTPYERSALATILGFSSARKEAFTILREFRRFKKIKERDVWAKCLNGTKFKVEFDVVLTNDTPKGLANIKRIHDILPEATVSSAAHIAHGWCHYCEREHRVARDTVLVKLNVHGVPLSSMYTL